MTAPIRRRPTHLPALALAIAVALDLALAAAPVAAGAPPAAPMKTTPPAAPVAASAPPQDEVAMLFRQAEVARDAGKYDEAATLLGKAWDLRKTWDIAANLGLNERKLGRFVEAAEHLSYALANLPPSSDEEAREGLAKALTSVRAEVAALAVSANVDGVEVLVNGASKGMTPLARELFAAAGSVTIVARKEGYEAPPQTIEVKKGEARAVAFTLVATQTAPAGGPRTEVIIGGAALAGLGVIVGVATGVAALGASGDAQKQLDAIHAAKAPCKSPADTDPCKSVVAKRNEQSALTNVAVFSLAGAGIAGIATGIYAYAARRKDSAAGLSIAPVVSANGGGLVIAGSW